MKFAIALLSIACFVFVSTADIDPILADKKKADALVNCVLEKGPCTPEAQKWKSSVRDIIDTHCGQCTEKEKTDVLKFLKYLISKRPADFEKMVQIYNINDNERKHLEEISQKV